jgi:hypothetical protein
MDQSVFRSPTIVSIVHGENIKVINRWVHTFMNGCQVDDRMVYQYEQFDKQWSAYTDQTTIFIQQFLPIRVAFPDLSKEGVHSLFKFYYSLWNSYSFRLKKQNGQEVPFKGNHFIITSLYNPDDWFPGMNNREMFLRMFPRTEFQIMYLPAGPETFRQPITYTPCRTISTCDVPYITPLPSSRSLPFNFFNSFVRKTSHNNSTAPPPFKILSASDEDKTPVSPYGVRMVSVGMAPPLLYSSAIIPAPVSLPLSLPLPPSSSSRYIPPAKRVHGERSVSASSVV